jgi:hypothetical protein
MTGTSKAKNYCKLITVNRTKPNLPIFFSSFRRCVHNLMYKNTKSFVIKSPVHNRKDVKEERKQDTVWRYYYNKRQLSGLGLPENVPSGLIVRNRGLTTKTMPWVRRGPSKKPKVWGPRRPKVFVTQRNIREIIYALSCPPCAPWAPCLAKPINHTPQVQINN